MTLLSIGMFSSIHMIVTLASSPPPALLLLLLLALLLLLLALLLALLLRLVRDRLVAACELAGVRFAYNASVERISPPNEHSHKESSSKQGNSNSSSCLWQLKLSSGASVTAKHVIFSTGACCWQSWRVGCSLPLQQVAQLQPCS
jgi:hypothetical protein